MSEDDHQVERAVIWIDGQPEELETPDGFETSEAIGLNNANLVVGDATRSSGMSQPVARIRRGSGALANPSAGSAMNVNENSLVVGWVIDGEAILPCIWTLHQEPTRQPSSAAVIARHVPRPLRFCHIFRRLRTPL